MNLLQLARAAESLVQERPPVMVEAGRCLLARNKAAACDICVTACPTGAIQISEQHPHVDAQACVRCGLCLHVCPTGVFDGHDDLNRLLYCVEQLVDRSIVEIACAPHPEAEQGDNRVDAVIRTSGCLTALGASAYVGLAALGVEQIRVRLDACAACPLAGLRPQIDQTLQTARDLLAAAEHPCKLDAAPEPRKVKARPVYSTRNPPVSRRGFFQALTRQGSGTAATIAPADEPQITGESYAPRERRRQIRALRAITPPPAAAVTGPRFARLTVDETCTACGVCARVCPTGALVMRQNDVEFALNLVPAACINCGLCTTLCETDSIRWDSAPNFGELLTDSEVPLRRGSLRRCIRCNTPFAGPAPDGLCPICAYRKRHPFGSRLPDAALKSGGSR